MRSATVATAMARPAPSCMLIAYIVLASRISSGSMSARPTVLYTVSPVDLVTPLTRVSAAMTHSGVTAVVNPSDAMTSAVPTVEATSSQRNPHRLISGVVSGLIPTLPTKMNAVTAPDFTGDQPNCVWNNSGSRNGAAPTTNQYAVPPNWDTRNVGTRSVRRLSSGCGACRRCQTAPASSRTDAAATPAVWPGGGAGSDIRCAA